MSDKVQWIDGSLGSEDYPPGSLVRVERGQYYYIGEPGWRGPKYCYRVVETNDPDTVLGEWYTLHINKVVAYKVIGLPQQLSLFD